MKIKKIKDGYMVSARGLDYFEVSGNTKEDALIKTIEGLEYDIAACLASEKSWLDGWQKIRKILEKL